MANAKFHRALTPPRNKPDAVELYVQPKIIYGPVDTTTMQRPIEQACHRGAYFTLQRLRGRPVDRYIHALQGRERLDRTSHERLIATELREALQFALAHVPLYSTEPWRESLSRSDAAELAAWPVLERQTVRERGAELLARGSALGRFYRSSSASTGTPVRVAWNPHGAAWGWANEYRVMLWYGVEPCVRTLLLWGSHHRLQDRIRNCRGFLTTELTQERLEEAAQYVLERRPLLWIGLPSAMMQLARYIRANYPQAPWPLVPFAKVGGEQLYPFQREELHKQLGTKVVEFYGCTEVGPIAAECPEGSMHLMTDNSYVEIFRDGVPAPPGEFGEIVATSLRNRAMPLVRCKVGDSGRISLDPCPCGRPFPVLTDLVARVADLFMTADGRRVHGSALANGLRELVPAAPLGAIRQVLFQQVDPLHWKVLVESDAGFDAAIAARFVELVRTHFGELCDVQIDRVALIPREPSGKFRYYRPAMLRTTQPAAEVLVEADYTLSRVDRVKMV
jgi:phenylacetate-CoA ligase